MVQTARGHRLGRWPFRLFPGHWVGRCGPNSVGARHAVPLRQQRRDLGDLVATRSPVVSMPVPSSSKARTVSQYMPSRGGERSLPFGEEKRISVRGLDSPTGPCYNVRVSLAQHPQLGTSGCCRLDGWRSHGDQASYEKRRGWIVGGAGADRLPCWPRLWRRQPAAAGRRRARCPTPPGAPMSG